MAINIYNEQLQLWKQCSNCNPSSSQALMSFVLLYEIEMILCGNAQLAGYLPCRAGAKIVW